MTQKDPQGGKPVLNDAEGPVTTGKVPQSPEGAPEGSQPTQPTLPDDVPPGTPPAMGTA
jgi:hypothetical protein